MKDLIKREGYTISHIGALLNLSKTTMTRKLKDPRKEFSIAQLSTIADHTTIDYGELCETVLGK